MSNECEVSECVPFVPTPDEEVRTAFHTVRLAPGEVVVELGCGDGKNLKLAAVEFGANGIGYELNPERAELARAANAGLPVKIHEKNFMGAKEEIKKADVVFVYLLQSVNQLIKPMLEMYLKPSARVVSWHYTFDDWKDHSNNSMHIYFTHPKTFNRTTLRVYVPNTKRGNVILV